MTGRTHGVRRRDVVLGLALIALGVGFVVILSEGLRHPSPTGETVPLDTGATGDPRDEVECPERATGEEDEAEDPVLAPRTPVQVSSSTLHDCPEYYDRALVTYEGEAVGALLRRRGGAWLQLNDDVYAGTQGPLPAHRDYRGGNDGIAVFVPHDVADRITRVGGPHQRGDIVAITGTFHRVDPTSSEVSVIRAQAGNVVRAGESLPDVRLPDREVAAAVLAALALGLVGWERARALRRRRP